MTLRLPSRRDPGPVRGLLQTDAPDGVIEHERVGASDAVASVLAHHWWVRWELRTPHLAQTLPHPTVHVTIIRSEADGLRAELSGVPTRAFRRTLAGRGWVFGLKFRPASFVALWPHPLHQLTDRVVPLREFFGGEADALMHAIDGTDSLATRVELAERWLAGRRPQLPAQAAALRDLVEHMQHDHGMRRAEDAAAHAGVELRTLQRQFRRYVGVSPKWVARRYRLHEVAQRLTESSPPSLAELAAELGYADQAHFSRDFSEVVGCAPGPYAARARAAAGR